MKASTSLSIELVAAPPAPAPAPALPPVPFAADPATPIARVATFGAELAWTLSLPAAETLELRTLALSLLLTLLRAMPTPIDKAPALPDDALSANAIATPKASARKSLVRSLALTLM